MLRESPSEKRPGHGNESARAERANRPDLKESGKAVSEGDCKRLLTTAAEKEPVRKEPPQPQEHARLARAKQRKSLLVQQQRKSTRSLLGRYALVRQIGGGAFSKVWKTEVLDVMNAGPRFVACKMVSKLVAHADPCTVARARQEARVLTLLSHPNIVKIYDWHEDSNSLYMFLELAQCDLLYVINSVGTLDRESAADIWFQILSAVYFLHLSGYAHRDIKLDNILCMTAECEVFKLADMGFCVPLADGRLHTNALGSLQYASPELLAGKPYLGTEVDVWALGVVLYALLCSRLPFLHNPSETTEQIRKHISFAHYSEPLAASSALLQLLKSVFEVDAKLRATTRQLIMSPWLQEQGITLEQRNAAVGMRVAPIAEAMAVAVTAAEPVLPESARQPPPPLPLPVPVVALPKLELSGILARTDSSSSTSSPSSGTGSAISSNEDRKASTPSKAMPGSPMAAAGTSV